MDVGDGPFATGWTDLNMPILASELKSLGCHSRSFLSIIGKLAVSYDP